MDEKKLAEALRSDPALLREVMGSRDAQDLLRGLERDREGFRRAVRSAAAGDSGDLARRIRELCQGPDGAALLERIGRSLDGQARYGGRT